MCTNARFVTNPYTNDKIFVDCGHCESCLQSKANRRTARIKNEMTGEKIALFVHLTYDRYGCPYVFRSDIDSNGSSLPVYREYFTYKDNKRVQRRVYDNVLLGSVPCLPFSAFSNGSFDGVDLRHRKGRVGVVYFPDVQNFEKRLRQNLLRNYNYEKKFKFFNCGEYGETTFRPHFHVLLFIDREDEQLFRDAVVSSWPFGDSNRLKDTIEIAEDAASYVSSYVNCDSSFSQFLRVNFPPRHSYSKDFGVNKKCFSLDSILQKISERNLSYSVQKGGRNSTEYIDIPIPKYIINRFFPKFKGFGRLDAAEIHHLVHYPQDLSNRRFTHLINVLDWSKEHYCQYVTMLNNAYKRYHALSGRSREEYAVDFYNAWKVHSLTCLNLFYRERYLCADYPEPFYYDNVNEFFYRPSMSPSMLVWVFECDFHSDIATLNPNDFPRRVAITNNLTDLYHKKLKTKKVNNVVLSQKYDDV